MTPGKARFDFLKVHFQDARKTFGDYRKKVIESLDAREESVGVVYNVAGDRGRLLLDEMARDIRIYKSRLERVNAKLYDVLQLIRRADTTYTDEAADEAIEAFFAWRAVRLDLGQSLIDSVDKWQGFEQEIYAHLQT